MKSAEFALQGNPKFIVLNLNEDKQIKSYHINEKNLTNILTENLRDMVDLKMTHGY